MAPPNVITPWSPEVILPGRPALGPNVERYTVAGGGSAVFALDAGDRIDIVPLEGGQPLELCAFAKDGKPALAALGLKGKAAPKALQEILATDRDDAARVRFGLFRHGIDIGRAKAAPLFDNQTPPGEIATFSADRAVVLVIAAPAPAGTVWDQASATDTLVLITRATTLPPQLREPPDPLAEPRLDLRINVASSIGFEVHEGEYIQIVDIAGRQCSDFLAFERRAVDAGRPLPLDSTTTRTMSGLAYPKPGLASRFYDRDRNPLVEVVQDTVGRHDTFGLACTSRTYEDAGYFGHANCSDNLNVTMAPYSIDGRRGWPAINFFYNTNVDHQNQIWFDEPWSRPGDYVLMRALSDLVCAATSCPDDIDPANGWQLTEIQVRVYPKTATFKRAMGYRMTADAPLQMTKETGFHPRTSELTRTFGEYRGYWVPHRFTKAGPIEEYWACREKVVIMDLSPLRKLEIMGPDAETFLQSVFPRDIRKLAAGQIFYTAICYEHGGMVDDGTLFRMCQNNFRWIGGDDASLLWLREQAAKSGANVHLKSATNDIHNVAVQGPKSRDTLRPLLWTPGGRPTLDELGVFSFTIGRFGGYDGIPVIVSRTGYTGEQGYEVFCHPKDAPAVWDAIMQSGAEHGIRPFGFDALDMVRIEAGLAFGGYEFDSTTDPFEAGIGFTVPTKKEEDYIGKAALERRRATPARKLVGLEIAGNEPAAHGDKIYAGRAEIGVVTSGMRSPLLKKTIALARVDVAHAELGTKLAIGKLDGHIKRLDATVVRFPFYDPEKTRVRS
ncbi:MAG: aminomethyltransferase [Hyphomicrobium sp. 32-62-53]|nr:MAG: aminomethyltransferase [Hyphomicrobium sp. 12-62-95]OYY00968.1 MAG: aminomethyltransferase [Hyphomicrobium sp. 32-62-53]